MNLKTEGIVIKRMNLGEADKILTIFTERFGKIKAISKGVRKIKSHLAGSLEPFMLVDFELYEGKTFYTITGACIKEDNENIHLDLVKISQAYYIAELIDRFFEERERSISAFSLLNEALGAINNSNKKIIIKAYCLKLLIIAGFQPELYNCVHCKRKILQTEQIHWDQTEGGVICLDCQKTFHHGKEVSKELIKLFRFFEGHPFSEIQKLKISTSLENESELIISNYIQGILEDKILKSKNFMLELNQGGE